MPPLVYALLLHGVLGFIDIVVNHELLAKLPARRAALLLFMNLGVLVTLAAFAFGWWQGGQAVLVPVDYGRGSWMLSAMAAGALGWAVRDGVAAVRLGRAAAAATS